MIHDLTLGTYDISSKMGTLLANQSRVKFTSLRGIRNAYSMAFSESNKKCRPIGIDKALSDTGLDALSLVRNLIVHKACVADLTYITDAKGVPGAPQLAEGQLLALDGTAVYLLVEPAIVCGSNLIRAVQKWVEITTPKKTK